MPDAPRQVTPKMNRDHLDADLERYCQKALDLGADEAKVVAVESIPVQDAVVFKCQVPRCYGYGSCAHCPPHAPKPVEVREQLKQYQRAILFIRRIPTEVMLRERTHPERRAAFRSIYEIVSNLESTAFFDGHYLATGFGAGSCKSALCGTEKTCQVLEGEACRFPVKARPSMEGVGMNVFQMVAEAGWEIAPIGSSTKPAEVPLATLVGIVVVQ